MLDSTVKSTFKDAAKKLTGHKKRAFQAKVAEDYFESSARKTETELGWCRHSIQLGLHERRTGILCEDNYQARGRQKSETKKPNLGTDIHKLVDAKSQTDPKFKSTFLYTQLSARAVRAALISEMGYAENQLPTRQTIGAILNRKGYRLKKLKKQNH
jgi:Rhodopirellula transposase DDE domain